MKILGIDPGLSGAFATVQNGKIFDLNLMPLINKEIDFKGIGIILSFVKPDHVFLERAIPFAMGSKSAFNYGRGFAAVELAIGLSGIPVTYVEPGKWTKEMHEGISADMKPKAKSLIALGRLYPEWLPQVPKSRTGKLHEGVVDALLIAGYGQRKIAR